MARAKAKPGLSQLTPEEVAFMKEDKQREQAYAEEAKYRKLIKELQAIGCACVLRCANRDIAHLDAVEP